MRKSIRIFVFFFDKKIPLTVFSLDSQGNGYVFG